MIVRNILLLMHGGRAALTIFQCYVRFLCTESAGGRRGARISASMGPQGEGSGFGSAFVNCRGDGRGQAVLDGLPD